jgi:hypothetical protein
MSKTIIAKYKFTDLIEPFLKDEDDPRFWGVAFNRLSEDLDIALVDAPKKYNIFFEIGACSNWLRPHQTRWKAAGGFAWPTGYGGGWLSRNGLPEFDWSLLFQMDFGTNTWLWIDKFSGKKKLIFRAALPTNTKRHDQAAVHTIWQPGSPKKPDDKLCQFYGFKKRDDIWQLVAHEVANENRPSTQQFV